MQNLPHILRTLTREQLALILGAAGIGGLITLFAAMFSAWIGGYFGARRAARRLREEHARHVERSGAELLALRETLEAVAVEVERISEGQRFTSRLLADRAAEQRAAADGAKRRLPGVPTPH